MFYLYLITRADGKRYIGVSNDPNRRFKEHIKGHGSKSLIGCTDAVLTILDEGPEQEIYSKEFQLIKELSPELNKAPGGCGGDTGCSPIGEAHGRAKLTEQDVVKIRELAATTNIVHVELARQFGVSRATIGDICSGKSWKHVDGPITKRTTRPSDVTPDKKLEIYNLYINGMKIADIARQLNIGYHSAFKYSKEVPSL